MREGPQVVRVEAPAGRWRWSWDPAALAWDSWGRSAPDPRRSPGERIGAQATCSLGPFWVRGEVAEAGAALASWRGAGVSSSARQ